MNPRTFSHFSILAVACLTIAAASTVQANLVAIERDTGNLFEVSTTDASLTLIGNTGVAALGALDYANDGYLYGLTTGLSAALYRIDPADASSTLVGLVGAYMFEGGLAITPEGFAYAVNGGDTGDARIFTIDLATGAGTEVGPLGDRRDVDGLGLRDDGMLIGLDRVNNELITINPVTRSTAAIASVEPIIGMIGGMALGEGYAYFSTAGPGSFAPGSNELYEFDPYTGTHTLIGNFNATVIGEGISGIAVIPEPASMALLVLGGLSLLRRRKK
ncbi:MAG: DUF4394 domain-containing protein [Planctomycetes bacterium]|nr:DUF4394 domain-containing protein [Planctomycetota bacterium]